MGQLVDEGGLLRRDGGLHQCSLHKHVQVRLRSRVRAPGSAFALSAPIAPTVVATPNRLPLPSSADPRRCPDRRWTVTRTGPYWLYPRRCPDPRRWIARR